jgi:septum formation protein
MNIILGSQSFGRKQMLHEMGIFFEVMPANIDEKSIRSDNPEELTLLLARAKADALLPKIVHPALLITSDQVTLCAGEIREKPKNTDEARVFLRSYAHHPAETITSVVVTHTQTRKQVEGIDRSRVFFSPFSGNEIDTILRETDCMFCSGGFMIDHPLFASHIRSIEGTSDGIIGLPKALTQQLLDGFLL